MSREKSWQVPGKGAVFTVPHWVDENCEGIYNIKEVKIILKDGSVATSGDWIILKNGNLTKK